MSYTILSAQWGNDEATSVVAVTEEVGAVALSQADTPEEWQNFLEWYARGNTVTNIVIPDPVPRTISDRQFFQQLAVLNVITQQEALDAVRTGAIPAALQALIDALPEPARFPAEMLISGAVEFRRNHDLVEYVRQALGWTSEQIDQLWRDAHDL